MVLVFYLAEIGLTNTQIGALLTLTLIGDTAISLGITLTADQLGRKRMLILGAILMMFAGGLFASTKNIGLLLIAATLGVISPSGNEVGPFLSIEQAALAQIVPHEQCTRVFAWYNLVGLFATAFGALSGGVLIQTLRLIGISTLGSYRAIVVGYAIMGGVLVLLFTRLSSAIETISEDDELEEVIPSTPEVGNAKGKTLSPQRFLLDFRSRFGLHRSRRVVFKLSALFLLDAFAGGFVLQSIVVYWFHLRFGVEPAVLGGIFFGANILAGVSALTASWLAARIGLVNTMVFTHVPSNILLMLVPLMPNLSLAITILLLRFSISQMDVPTRQSYTMSVVSPRERAAAAGVTGIARTLGAAIAPVFIGPLLGSATLLSLCFFSAGGLKIMYDILLYRGFRTVQPVVER